MAKGGYPKQQLPRRSRRRMVALLLVVLVALLLADLPSTTLQPCFYHAKRERRFHLSFWLFWAFVAAVAASGVVIVHEAEVVLVERLGRFEKQLEPGLHFILPVICRIRWRGSVREQVLDIPPQGCVTSDNAPLKADAVVYWRVVEPMKFVYELQNAIAAIQNLVLTQLRAEVGVLTLDETFSARTRLNQALLSESNEATKPWGVKITRVEVRDIIPNQEILQAMELQMAAERKKRAQIIKSEGEKSAALNEASARAEALMIESRSQKEARILAAEAEKESLVRQAEGVADALRMLTEAAGGDIDRAARLQVLRAHIDAQTALAKSPNAKVMLFPAVEELGARASAMLGELQAGAFSGAFKQQLRAGGALPTASS